MQFSFLREHFTNSINPRCCKAWWEEFVAVPFPNLYLGGFHSAPHLLWRGDVAARQLLGQLHEAGRDGRAHRQGQVRPGGVEDRLHPRDRWAEEKGFDQDWILAWSAWLQVSQPPNWIWVRCHGKPGKQDPGCHHHKSELRKKSSRFSDALQFQSPPYAVLAESAQKLVGNEAFEG